jgi:polyisoprenoid-binding protein YceI
MTIRLGFLLLCLFGGLLSYGQKYTLEKSTIIFFSDAAIEDIKAENSKSSGLLNVMTGDVAFMVPIKEFEFDKSLMKEHFNEKYLESDKFPKAVFQGKFLNLEMDKTGQQIVNASGKLTIHGVSKEVEFPGTMEIKGNRIVAKSKFTIRLLDYKIEIPQLLWQNIAEEVEVTVEFIYKPI